MNSQEFTIASGYRTKTITLTSGNTKSIKGLLDAASFVWHPTLKAILEVNITPSADITLKDPYNNSTFTISANTTKRIPSIGCEELVLNGDATVTIEVYFGQ